MVPSNTTDLYRNMMIILSSAGVYNASAFQRVGLSGTKSLQRILFRIPLLEKAESQQGLKSGKVGNMPEY